MGIEPIKEMQTESMDDGLRTALWNFTFQYISIVERQIGYGKFEQMLVRIWCHFLIKHFENYRREYCLSAIKEIIISADWYRVYDFIELFIRELMRSEAKDVDSIVDLYNQIFTQEKASYRLFGNEIVQITNEQEIKEIEEVLEISKGRFKGVHTHFESSLKLLSDRKNPNYRKSIDESILAVESICQIICNDKNATLGKALSKIEREGTIQISGVLKEAYSKIYGYASSSDGIRHALSDEPNIYYEDAKYMLVACTSFVNYLIVKSEKAGVFAGNGEDDE